MSHSTLEGIHHQESEDIYGEAILRLGRRLRDLPTDPDSGPIN